MFNSNSVSSIRCVLGRSSLALAIICFALIIVDTNPAAAQGRLKVLLLGDSYTAGNGARQASGGTDNFGPKGCYRSNSNWGQKYINQLNSLGYSVTLVNRACSGSVSNDLLYDNDMEAETSWMKSYSSLGVSSDTSDDELYKGIANNYNCERREQGEEYYRFSIDQRLDSDVMFSCRRYIKAQLDSVDESVDVVLMTLGGNDARFSDVIMKCFAPIMSSSDGCAEIISNSNKASENKDNGSYQSNMQEIFTKLRGKLRSDAKVVLLNYPYLAKDDNFILKDIFSDTSYEASKNVRELGRLGDEVQSSIIPSHQLDKANFYYFDEVKNEFTNHEPDMSDILFNNKDKWLNTFNSRLPTDWFHPNTQGHQAIADLLYRDLETKVDGLPFKTHLDYDVVFITNEAAEAQQYQKDDLASKGIQIGQIRDKILGVANTARFGLIDYNLLVGYNKTGPGTKLMQDFTSNINQLALKMPRSTTVEGRTQPGELKNALDMALGLKWRPGVKKLIYVIGKTDGDDSTYGTEYYQNIIEKALSLDPVAISTVRAGNQTTAVDGQATNLADKTNGQIVSPVGMKYYFPVNVTDAINTQTLAAPYAWAGEGVTGKIDDQVALNAAGSYDVTGITKYEWDVDNDGSYDVSSELPLVQYTYHEPYTGLVVLRVTNQGGATALASMSATITLDGDSIVDDQDNCPFDWNEDQADADSDGIGDVCDDAPGIAGYDDGKQIVSTEPETPTDQLPEEPPAETPDPVSDHNDSADEQQPDAGEYGHERSDSESTQKNRAAGLFSQRRLLVTLGTKTVFAHPSEKPDDKISKPESNTSKHTMNKTIADIPILGAKNHSGKSWLLFGGIVSGFGIAAYVYNSELFEDEEL